MLLLNVAQRLTVMAEARPDAIAVVEPLGYDARGKRRYRHVTFRQLDDDSDRIARGLRELGVTPGTRLALLVRPGIDFISLVFGLFKAGAVAILIDPGMGRRNLIRCLAEAEPEGFVAIPMVQAVRALLRRRFPKARFNVTVGRRWFWGGATLEQLRGGPWSGSELAADHGRRSGGDHLHHRQHRPAQGRAVHATAISTPRWTRSATSTASSRARSTCPGFPLFGLFNCAMGVTAVIPDMDPSRPPGSIRPRSSRPSAIGTSPRRSARRRFGTAWAGIARSAASGCRRSAACSRPAPRCPAEVLRRMKACIHPEGDVHTPYGATEALPVASIAASEVLWATRPPKTRQGAGVCVGRRFSGIQWKVIRTVDGPIRLARRGRRTARPARSAN